MQGSLQEWIEAGGPIETDSKTSLHVSDLDMASVTTTPAGYEALEDVNSVTMDQMLKFVQVSDSEDVNNSDSIIVDARSAARFRAEAPEPRPGLRRECCTM